jgi:hypothetical protein
MSLRILIPLVIVLFDFFSYSAAQDLQIESGNKTKTIKAGTFIEVVLPTPNDEPCAKCKYNRMAGEFLSYADDKVQLRIAELSETIVSEKTNIGYQQKIYTHRDKSPVLTIPKDIILSIELKGKKKLRDNKVGFVVGQVLTTTGVALLAGAGLNELSEGNQDNLLWVTGGTGFITGILFLSFFPQKVYITNESCPEAVAGRPIWEIK